MLVGVPQQVTSLLTATMSPLRGLVFGRCGLIALDIRFAAQLLGLTPFQLLAELNLGKTLAEIAAAVGKTVEGVTATATAAATTAVTSAAAAGNLTQSQATSLTTTVTQQVTSVVTTVLGP